MDSHTTTGTASDDTDIKSLLQDILAEQKQSNASQADILARLSDQKSRATGCTCHCGFARGSANDIDRLYALKVGITGLLDGMEALWKRGDGGLFSSKDESGAADSWECARKSLGTVDLGL